MSDAISGQNATISVSTDGTNFTEVGEVTSFDGIGGGSASILDVTHLKSTAKEKKLGLKDEGSVSLGGNFVDSDAGQGMLKAARNNGTSLTMKVELDNADTTSGTTWEFDVYVQTFKIGGVSVDDKVTFDCGCEITGSVTETAAV